MAKISYARHALKDLERISDYLTAHGADALETLDLIDEAVGILARHPLIGRPAEYDMHELIISHGGTGYVALYSWEAEFEAVLVLALRHRRQAGFQED